MFILIRVLWRPIPAGLAPNPESARERVRFGRQGALSRATRFQ
jgi:hypothetical protein